MADRENRHLPSASPAVATAERGVVLLDGPQGVVAALTPEAAAATGESLCRAAFLAVQQRGDANVPVPLRSRE